MCQQTRSHHRLCTKGILFNWLLLFLALSAICFLGQLAFTLPDFSKTLSKLKQSRVLELQTLRSLEGMLRTLPSGPEKKSNKSENGSGE